MSKLKVTFPLTVILIAICLALACWMGTVAYLTQRENHACQESANVNQGSTLSPKNAELQKIIDEYSAQNGGVGLQLTVITPDDLAWSGAAGYADIGNKCPMTSRHHLYIGSMTKLFTSSLIMGQVEKAALTLDDPINSWIQLQNASRITIRNLLNQTSGLPDYAR